MTHTCTRSHHVGPREVSGAQWAKWSRCCKACVARKQRQKHASNQAYVAALKAEHDRLLAWRELVINAYPDAEDIEVKKWR